MCMMCDGASLDEVRFHVHGGVIQRGWSVMSVEEDDTSIGWAYTIGLAELHHPELVVVGNDPGFSRSLLDYLGEAVRESAAFAAGAQAVVADTFAVSFVEVHEEQYEKELLAMWFDYYESLGTLPPVLEVLQVVVPERPYCQERNHRRHQPLLNTPEDVLKKERPNRATRRTHQPHRRR